MTTTQLSAEAIALLKQLIETPSFSSEEDQTALHIEGWFKTHGIAYQRHNHNVWATNVHFDASKPTLLLNSHHDTVKPNNGYTKDPFKAIVEDGKLYGLGSNDAGGCLVSLLATFTYFYNTPHLKYNLVMVASAEEESSGSNGLNSMLPIIPHIDVAIVGEPTLMPGIYCLNKTNFKQTRNILLHSIPLKNRIKENIIFNINCLLCWKTEERGKSIYKIFMKILKLHCIQNFQ